ncbi:DUF397 domain-containing protein [Streptomyces sp. 4N509B]|uniref:DUF397 domain-containing protein n=1 Tax=Streptomyces sp. 4N509B TaxID=3457413 RepID=UPI003FD65FC4
MHALDKPRWHKSSFSSAGNNCLELATVSESTFLFRESDEPGTILTTSPSRLAALLTLARSGPRLS